MTGIQCTMCFRLSLRYLFFRFLPCFAMDKSLLIRVSHNYTCLTKLHPYTVQQSSPDPIQHVNGMLTTFIPSFYQSFLDSLNRRFACLFPCLMSNENKSDTTMKTNTTISPVLYSTRYSKQNNIATTTYQEGDRYNSVYTTEITSSSMEPGECSTSELTRVERGSHHSRSVRRTLH